MHHHFLTVTPPQAPSPTPLPSAGSPPSGLPIPAAVLIDEVRSRLFVVADGLWEGHPEATHGPQPLFQFCDLHGGGKKLGMTQTCFLKSPWLLQLAAQSTLMVQC